MKKYQFNLVPQSIWKAMPDADEVYVYSLIPISKAEIEMLGNSVQIPIYSEYLHDYPISQKIDVTEKDARVQLMQMLIEDTNTQIDPKRCFSPRHGISIRTGNQQTDLLLCYECYWLLIPPGQSNAGGYPLDTNSQAFLNTYFDTTDIGR